MKLKTGTQKVKIIMDKGVINSPKYGSPRAIMSESATKQKKFTIRKDKKPQRKRSKREKKKSGSESTLKVLKKVRAELEASVIQKPERYYYSSQKMEYIIKKENPIMM